MTRTEEAKQHIAESGGCLWCYRRGYVTSDGKRVRITHAAGCLPAKLFNRPVA